jgi:ABC-type oligopeptide transport system substrate-binding subunit
LVRLRTAINVAIERDHLTRNVAENVTEHPKAATGEHVKSGH